MNKRDQKNTPFYEQNNKKIGRAEESEKKMDDSNRIAKMIFQHKKYTTQF